MKDEDCKVIAVCLSKIHQETQQQLIYSIYDRALELGYSIIVINSFNDMYFGDRSALGQSKIFNLINYNLIDGIIILSETIKNKRVLYNISSNAQKHNIPLVSIDKKLDYAYNVLFSYENSMEKIIRHIVEDHKLTRINFIAGNNGNEFSEQRLNIYKKVLKENNIPIEEARIGYGDFWSKPTEKVVEGFLKSDLPLPQAIICANDTMAICTCEVLHKYGYSVPKDVIVTGFDGITQEKYHVPRLTTARQNNTEAGKCAVNILNKIFNGITPNKENIIYHDFIIASSCGCVPISPINSNVLTSELYNKLNEYIYYENQMQSMMSVMTDSQSISEMISKVPPFSNTLQATELWICVSENFLLSQTTNSLYDYEENPYNMLRVLVHSFKNDYSELPNFNVSEMLPNLLSILKKQDEKFLLFSPLHFQEKPIGYIVVATHPLYFEFNKHLLFSMAFSNILEIVQAHSELKQAIYKLEEMYIQDFLTGLMNRRGFYKNIGPKIKEVNIDITKKFMVISIDLNGLKYINDVFGHAEGDNALKTVARCMVSNSVKDEVCARFGGDEFIVAGVIEENSNYANEYINQFRSSIDYYNKYSNKPYEVGVSCGVYIGIPTKEADIDEMIKRADDIMYEEKSRTKYNHGR